MSEKKKDTIMYLGIDKYFNHIYKVVNSDNSLGRSLCFSKKMFRKGSVGALYECTLNGGEISYNDKQNPFYFIKIDGTFTATSLIFPAVIDLAEKENEINLQAKARQTKKPSRVNLNIENIRDVYKQLNSSQRSAFIGKLIYDITK